jgi:hypothetical protein
VILPTKGIRADGALISVGADLLRLTSEPKTVSRLWEELRKAERVHQLTYDWFVLGLDLLFLLGTVDFDRGRVRRVAVPAQIEAAP